MKRYIVILMALFIYTGLFAQGEMDAIRLSSSDLQGTARGQAMGGAFGALGGEVTGIMINPAGLGLYRSSEVNFTMALNSVNLKTDWQNSINQENKVKFNFDNVSYVGYYPTGYTNFPALNFAFSFNRLKNFNRRYSASGANMNTSLTDYIVAITNGHKQKDLYDKDYYNPYNNGNIPWLSTLGWNGWLIDPVNDNDANDAYKSILFSGETVAPRLEVNERGYIESYDFSLGGNLWDQLYLGLTFSVTDLFYHWDSSYGEEFGQREKIGLNNYLETEGSGYQAKFGALWRPSDFLRLGVAYHSPIWYYLTDYYQGSTIAKYIGTDAEGASPEGALTHYRLNTPYSWVFSVAGVMGTQAIVSLDYEFKDYRSMRLMDGQGNPKMDSNGFIEEDFKAASTLRAGLEYRFTPQFSGRLGYSYAQNPYERIFKDGGREAMIVGTIPHYTIDGDVSYFTAGIGYRFTPSFYIDAAFIYRMQNDKLYYYPSVFGADPVVSTPASLTNRTCKGLVTMGYKF